MGATWVEDEPKTYISRIGSGSSKNCNDELEVAEQIRFSRLSNLLPCSLQSHMPSAQDNSIAKSLPAFFPQQYMPLTIEVSSLRIRICRTNRVIRIRREQLLVVCIVQPHRVCLCVWWAAWLERMRFFRTCSKPAFWTGSWHGAVSPSCLGHLSQL